MRTARPSLNKEKVAFLAATLIASVALHRFIASGPSPLVLSAPSTREPGPDSQLNLLAIQNRPIDELIDGDGRESPFHPVRPPIIGPEKKTIVEDSGGAKPSSDKGEVVSKNKVPQVPLIEAEVDYMGVTVVDGQPHGLLKPKNGATPFLVTKGELISAYSCTVLSIEPQAIQIVDNDNRSFILKDRSYSKEGRAR